nr:histidine kinase [Thauera aminoaromatica]
GDVVFLATLAAESPNPFDTLLGSRQRGELLEASVADGLDRDGFDTLMSEARASRQELISAACG